MKDQGKLNFVNINKLLKYLNISTDKLVLAEQVHGSGIAEVNDFNGEKYFKEMDGLITAKRNVFLGIVTADCLPVLFYDVDKKITGAAHCGYKGISKKIIKQMINKFRDLGSDLQNISVAVGPGICSNCYNVPDDRIKLFQDIFPMYKDWYKNIKDLYYLDLKKIVFSNLTEEGINPKQIEISQFCTAHQNDRFFSYRKEGGSSGRIISLIGTL